MANEGSGDLAVLSPLGSIVRRIELGYGSAPYGVVFAPDGRAPYVTLGAGRLLKLDTRGTVVGELELGARPRGIAVSGDSTRILVTRFVSAFAESGAVGEVYEVDAASFTVARRRGANAPLREEILSTPAPSSVIACWRQGNEVPSTGDTRDLYGRLLRYVYAGG